jgi:uncharacterized protein YabN with tetrapyrrole methylase and pyrophosphatase domain
MKKSKVSFMHDAQQQFGELISILEKLRGPDGCPWD